MKKNNYILISGFIAVSFLFGSCKSLTNFSIEKRQHRGGYYVDWGNSKVKTDPAKNTAAVKEQKDKKKAPAAKATATPTIRRETAAAVEQPETKPATTATPDQKSESYSKNSFKVKEEPVAQKEKASKKLSSFSYSFSDLDKGASSDTPDWVLAVLCILLPPLAVFLAVGIGSEFWISILLTLLFWIPGVIYAFIICF